MFFSRKTQKINYINIKNSNSDKYKLITDITNTIIIISMILIIILLWLLLLLLRSV